MEYYFQEEILPTVKNPKLSGSAKREENAKYCGEEALKVSCLWLKSQEKEVLFISVDTLYIPKSVSLPLYAFFAKEYGLSSAQITFSATHTHSAPAIEKVFDKEAIHHEAYILEIIQIVCNICAKDKRNFTQGKVTFIQDSLPNNTIISRRKVGRDIRHFFLKKKMLMLPNPQQEIDRSVSILSLQNAKGELEVIVYNFACHPVFNKNSQTSSDFVGKISGILKDRLGVKSMFLQAFQGDIRPDFSTNKLLEAQGINKIKLFFNQAVFKTYTYEYFNIFSSKIAQKIIKSLDNKNAKEKIPLDYLEKEYTLCSRSQKVQHDFYIKYILLDTVLLISIPAEVTSAYALELKKAFPLQEIMFLGLADGIIGYLPFYKEIEEGGYEVNSATNYIWDSPLDTQSLNTFYSTMLKDIQVFLGSRKC